MIAAPIGHNQLRPAMSVNSRTVTYNTTIANPFGVAKSMYFPGNVAGRYVEINATSKAFTQGGLSAGTGEFTMECFVYCLTVPTSGEQYIFEQAYGGPVIYLNAGKIAFGWSMQSALYTGWALTANTWYHIAVSRSGTTLRFFANGSIMVVAGSTSDFTQNPLNSTSTYLGAGYSSGTLVSPFSGLVCEARFSTVARYPTNSFVPPTKPFTDDPYTALLIHGDGANGSDAITDDNT